MSLALPEDPHHFANQRSWRGFDPEKHPIIAVINVLAAHAMVVLGPMLWAALVVLWVVAEFSS
jgi:hypothetical protein